MKMLLKLVTKSRKFVVKKDLSCINALGSIHVLQSKCLTRNYTTTINSQRSYNEQLEILQRNGFRFGQPTHFSHPHLLKENELAVGVLPSEFAERRKKFMDKIQERCHISNQNHRNIVIIPGSMKKYMTGKIPYFFRQNSDFFYLTGCLEPESILVLCSNDKNHMDSMLFMREKNSHDELWDGPRTGVEKSIEFFGMDNAYSLKDFLKFYDKFVTGQSTNVWYDDSEDMAQSHLTQQLKSQSAYFQSPVEFLHELRVIKSPAEVNLMRQTCEIASKAVNQTMKETRPGDSEHHIHARVDFHCRMNNASFLAYPPVVAAGDNANTIHYINNTQVAKDGDMVLMDAGCEYGGYSSDITRTWPVNGHFTPAQELLYDVVHAVQTELINTVSSAGDITLDQLFQIMAIRLGKYLQEIGLIDKSLTLMEASHRAMAKFCPHHVSHYLGMDIHDTPTISRSRNLEPGMVFTIEPGLYISANSKDVPAQFRGIGIRIEDDVLCTENGIEVLTKNCIKDKAELTTLILR